MTSRPGKGEESPFQAVLSCKAQGGVSGSRILWILLRQFLGLERYFAGHEAEALDRRTAEIGVDPRAQRAALMLQEQRCRGIGFQCKDGAGRTLGYPQRPRDSRHLGPGNLAPAQHQCRVVEACAQERGTGEYGDINAD